ncbi:MAG: helix-turn-helix transcriptional regulator [Chloroflexi bacterium]|nr:helix-turn-helix transcriptional regulator [Chloroflexota bacterium]
MTTSLRVKGLAHKLSQIAGKDRDATEFRCRANDLMKKTVGWDFAVWSTVDPPTVLFTSCILFDVQPDPRVEPKLFELEFAGGDVNQFADLARAKQPAGSLHVTTQGNPERSRRFRELLQPIGCGDELRAVFKSGDAAWGALVAYRTTNSGKFSEADSTLVSQVGPIIADGLRHCLLRTAAEAPHRLQNSPGVVLLSKDGRILETTSTAERWSSLVNGPKDWSTVVSAVAAKTRTDGAIVSVPVRTQTGQWIVLHGSHTGSGAVAIIVEEARGIHLTGAISGVYGLTLRERDVTEGVLHGQSTKEICENLKISPHTVQDHLKSIFDKVGVRSRGGLASLFFNGHYVERRRAGSTPSPYGWYLSDEHL